MYPDKILGLFTLYGLMIAIGIGLCFLVIVYYCRKAKVEEKFIDFLLYDAIAAIVVGFFFAALFQGVYNYIEDPSKGFSLNGGITFIGGLIGGAITFVCGYLIFRKKFNNKIGDVMTIIPCAILVAHGFGRIGCFFAGCCYGRPTDSWIGIKFQTTATKVIPTNLIEAVFLLAMFGVCTYLFLKKKYTKNFPLYVTSYGIFRFVIEFFRGDHRGSFIGGISPSQFWSILMIVIGIAMFVVPLFVPVLKKIFWGPENREYEEKVIGKNKTFRLPEKSDGKDNG